VFASGALLPPQAFLLVEQWEQPYLRREVAELRRAGEAFGLARPGDIIHMSTGRP
jgi:hypothetical protein